MEFRRATIDDMESFLLNRIEFVTSLHSFDTIEAFENSTRAYLRKNIESGNTVIFLAIEDGAIIASCMACLFETAPLLSCLSGKGAELLNVYTKEGYRRKGLATKLLALMLGELRMLGVEKVSLKYTEAGLSLYESLGFTPTEHRMELCLT